MYNPIDHLDLLCRRYFDDVNYSHIFKIVQMPMTILSVVNEKVDNPQHKNINKATI